MYMHTRPPFVLQGMVALPSFIILDFCVCNFNLVQSDSSSAELWLLVDTHHDTRIGAEVSAILTFSMQSWPIEMVWGMFAHSANTLHHQLEGRFPIMHLSILCPKSSYICLATSDLAKIFNRSWILGTGRADVGDVARFLLSNPHLIRWGKVGASGGFVTEYHPQGWGIGNHDSDKSPPCPTCARPYGG